MVDTLSIAIRRAAASIACAGAVAAGADLLLFTAATAQYVKDKPALELSDCDQDHLATLALRACGAILNSPDLDEATRLRVLILRGKAWLSELEPAEAAADFSSALRIDPKNVEALERRAKAYTLAGEHDKAAADWTRVIALNPNHMIAYHSRGTSNLAAGNHTQALEDFAKALAIDPKSVESHLGRAAAFVARNERDKAMQEYDAALVIDPNSARAHIERAEAAEKWGNTKLAIESYLLAVKANGMLLKPRMALQRLGVETPTPP